MSGKSLGSVTRVFLISVQPLQGIVGSVEELRKNRSSEQLIVIGDDNIL